MASLPITSDNPLSPRGALTPGGALSAPASGGLSGLGLTPIPGLSERVPGIRYPLLAAAPVDQPKPPAVGNTPDLKPLRDDPARQKLAEEEALRVAKLTAELYVIARVVPHPVARAAAVFLAGLHEGARGKIRPGVQTGGNFAPVPLGYVEPEVYGLKRNWWLPSGITEYIPLEADALGVGLPQQRREDSSTRAIVYRAKLRAAVEDESLDTLRQVASGQYSPFSRAAVVVATSEVGFADLRATALAEVTRREFAALEASLATPQGSIPAGQSLPSGFVELAGAMVGGFDPRAIGPTSASGQAGAAGRNRVGEEAHVETRDP